MIAEEIISGAANLLGKVIPDSKQASQDKQAARQADLQFADAQSKVLIAEAQSESWLARNWRPIIGLEFGTIIFIIVANNNIVFPLLNAYGIKAIALPLDPNIWQGLFLCLGAYMGGRSAEKITNSVLNTLISKWKR